MAETQLAAPPDLPAAARAAIPGGVNSSIRTGPGSDGLVFTRSSGTRLWTYDGRELVDFQNGYGATILGHNDPDVNRAVREALETLDNPGFGVTDNEVAVAERIISHIDSVDKVVLVNSGSEATFYALRLARAATGRRKIVKFEGAYHGWHDSVALNSGTPADQVGTRVPFSTGILPEVVAETEIATWNDLASVQEIFDRYPGQIAAVIVDPILSSAGGILPDAEFVQGLRTVTSAAGTVLIFDEMITGFRLATGGLQSILGVRPDLTTMGKAMGNGYPIAAVGGRADLMDQFATHPAGHAFLAGTYNGHPAMAAAAVATIDKLDREPVHEHLARLGDLVRTGLQEMYDGLGVPAVVSGYGSMFFPFFLEGAVRDWRDTLRHDGDLLVRYRARQLERGILETPINPKNSKLNYAHTDGDIERLIETTRACVLEVLAERSAEGGLR